MKTRLICVFFVLTSGLGLGAAVSAAGAAQSAPVVPRSSKAGVIALIGTNFGTKTLVAASTSPSVYGQPVTFTATVTPVSGRGKMTGKVQFYEANGQVDALTDGLLVVRYLFGLTGPSIKATFTTSSLAAGPHNIRAIYVPAAGGGSWRGSTSRVLRQTVDKDATRTEVSSSASPSVYGQPVTFTATVAAVAPGAVTPTGSVQFMDGAVFVAAGDLNGDGKASVAVKSAVVGTHTITATYSGDLGHTGSTSSLVTQTVDKAGTRTDAVSSAAALTVTFTATVAAVAPGVGTPTGSVQFMDGGVTVATGDLNGDGKASVTINAPELGTHSITAVYIGDSNFATSSTTVKQ